MTWQRLIFWLVYLLTWIPLWLLFVCGYVAEGVTRQIDRLERWAG